MAIFTLFSFPNSLFRGTLKIYFLLNLYPILSTVHKELEPRITNRRSKTLPIHCLTIMFIAFHIFLHLHPTNNFLFVRQTDLLIIIMIAHDSHTSLVIFFTPHLLYSPFPFLPISPFFRFTAQLKDIKLATLTLFSTSNFLRIPSTFYPLF